MWSLMAACDVLVNLRYPTMGETSGSVIRALSLGRPLVVSDVGWFSELPDDVVLKVPVDEYEVATLEAALGLAADRRRGARRERAPRTSSASIAFERVADRYVAALETAAGGDAVDDAVLLRIAEAAVEVGDRRRRRARARRRRRRDRHVSARRASRRPALARRDRRPLGRRADRARRADAGAVDHGRRAHLLGAREVGRAPTDAFWFAASRRAATASSIRSLIAPAFRVVRARFRPRTRRRR